MLFDPLICTDLQLICTLQITANQTLSTFEKRYKTRANQRKSLQITSLKNHSKNDADLQSKWRVRPGQQSWWDGKRIFVERWMLSCCNWFVHFPKLVMYFAVIACYFCMLACLLASLLACLQLVTPTATATATAATATATATATASATAVSYSTVS